MSKLIVISGCSGGGKSTIISELNNKGYTVIEEIGRKVVKEQLVVNSGITPWEEPQEFCKLLIDKSIEVYHKAEEMNCKNNVIFFDRSFLEGISYFQALQIHKYDYIINELRYYSTVFMTPPWKEIYTQDAERKHSFEDAVREYERLIDFYPQYGYRIIELPKISVKSRIKFILSAIA